MLPEYATWITTIVPTTVARCVALGVGGSRNGVILHDISYIKHWCKVYKSIQVIIKS